MEAHWKANHKSQGTSCVPWWQPQLWVKCKTFTMACHCSKSQRENEVSVLRKTNDILHTLWASQLQCSNTPALQRTDTQQLISITCRWAFSKGTKIRSINEFDSIQEPKTSEVTKEKGTGATSILWRQNRSTERLIDMRQDSGMTEQEHHLLSPSSAPQLLTPLFLITQD